MSEKLECEQAIKLILEYLDNELSEHDHDAMHAHMETCRACYSRMDFEKMLKDKVRSSSESNASDKKAPDSLRNKIKKITENY